MWFQRVRTASRPSRGTHPRESSFSHAFANQFPEPCATDSSHTPALLPSSGQITSSTKGVTQRKCINRSFAVAHRIRPAEPTLNGLRFFNLSLNKTNCREKLADETNAWVSRRRGKSRVDSPTATSRAVLRSLAKRLRQLQLQPQEPKMQKKVANEVQTRERTSKNAESPLKENRNEANLVRPSSTIYDYNLGEQIGKGAYAVVRSATHVDSGREVAIKVYERVRLLQPQKRRSVAREIAILRELDHPNIVKFYDTFETPKNVFVVMELAKGESLRDFLRAKPGRKLPEPEARLIFSQIVSAINYCHRMKVSHRDVKLENIIIDRQHHVKMIDFGFSVKVPAGQKLRVFCGTPSYMAPEIVNRKEYFGPPADMWAVGVLLYAMVCGQFPFKGSTDSELFKKIVQGTFVFPQGVSESAKRVISRLLLVETNKRPTCEELLRDPFLSEPDVPELGYPELCVQYRKRVVDQIVRLGVSAQDFAVQMQAADSKVSKLYHKLLSEEKDC